MTTKPAIPALFAAAALYDGVLGAAFLVMAPRLFESFSVTPPNHYGYVHFPAALLVVFAIMFAVIAKNPVANRNLIPYGILLKMSYCGVTFFHWFTNGIPGMWKPFAIIDLVFMACFIAAYVTLSPKPEATADD